MFGHKSLLTNVIKVNEHLNVTFVCALTYTCVHMQTCTMHEKTSGISLALLLQMLTSV